MATTPESSNARILLCTFPNAEEATRVGREAVEQRIAACVNLIPSIQSIYRWKENIETATETLALFKTTQERYPDLERFLKQSHSYETPEIVVISIENGSPDYLTWIQQCVI
jgi:periplasmic divalent cation tolerance protein